MTTVTSPVAGRAVPLSTVPDPVFADALVGPGAAVDPVRLAGDAVAPVDGIVIALHPHAFTVVDPVGHGVLTQLGVDTVQLAGEGFEQLVGKGDRVRRGQPVIRWDPSAVAESGTSPLCAVVALDASTDALTSVSTEGDVRHGDPLFTWP